MNIVAKNILAGFFTFTLFMSFGAIHECKKKREARKSNWEIWQAAEKHRIELKVDRIFWPY